MKNIYYILDLIEKRPAMFLGNGYGITALNNFVQGFGMGGGRFYDEKLNYPDFSLFTDWLGGVLKYKYEKSSINWSGLLLDSYPDDKKALEKFFYYLKKYKASGHEVVIIPLTKKNIQYAIDNNANYLWCKVDVVSNYYKNLKEANKIVLFKLTPSRTLFSLIIDKNKKVIETRNTDMTDKYLRKKIEKQFGISLNKWKMKSTAESKKILKQFKII